MNFAEKIRTIPNFPIDGVDFLDITTLLKEGDYLREAINCLGKFYENEKIDLVLSPESRGFILGSPLAYLLGAGFVPARKEGKLPAPTIKKQYFLEYGSDVLEIHKDAISSGMRVLIVDDVLATGGTALVLAQIVEQLGAEVAGFAFLLEISSLAGRKKIDGYKISTLL